MAAPLTPDDRRRLDESIKELAEAKQIVTRAKAAGLDMSAEEAQIKELEQQLVGLRRSFFPTGGSS